MILIALLPLGLLALAQTWMTMRQTDETRLAASVGHTLQDALREIRLIRASQVTAQLLANSLRKDPESCASQIAAYATSDGRISRAGFVDASGAMRCSSDGVTRDFSQTSRFASILASDQPRIFHDPEWSDPGQSDISLTWPVSEEPGRPAGFVLLWLPESALIGMPEDPVARPAGDRDSPLALIAANGAGEVIYASTGIAGAPAWLPRGASLQSLTASEAHSFFDSPPGGETLMFSWAPINTDLFLLGVWPLPAEDSFFRRHVLPYLFPALMWLTGVAVTILGVERLVTRHVRRLSREMRDFTSGNRLSQDSALDRPPAEIASLAEDYHSLTATILRDEAEMENLVRQKDELLREVHHRTGNSLQLIASFLRMHRRETDDIGIRLVLDDLHNRVMSLSSVHLGLYRMAGGTEVAVDLLMAEVIAKVDLIHGRSGQKGAVQADLMPLVLQSQQAVPLALLLAEILSCFPPSEAGDQPVRIRLSHGPATDYTDAARTGPAETARTAAFPASPGPGLEGSGQTPPQIARLEVSGAISARGRLTGEHSGAPSVIGARLIRGFVTQLPGDLQIIEEGARIRAMVTFAFDPSLVETDAATGNAAVPGSDTKARTAPPPPPVQSPPKHSLH
ncbi:sensor histidine kinase [Pseudogemmobacter bohemicus]|uniref:sensor histidine kinase n=1 Tax=Pseudogemmobacter bohemicus TaxID=2250708 RepID=UPI001300548F|nr:histidine kinase dimerization/phosphoacceptor domain -containing protein [Pseudogemmobacter bohemicus]